ncbi:MAG: NAD(P)/FAD-dependent oxidoreductase [Candidatus Latescibacterota bacterium]
METTDVVVVGGGPAGSTLASLLADKGIETILLEKRPQIGVPVRCGEATGNRQELSHFIPIDESWISADINGIRLIAPGGEVVERRLPQVGVVLDRAKFDQALARQAEQRGADIRIDTEVTGLLRDNGAISGVRVLDRSTGTAYNVHSKITIGADGIEGFIARWAGLTRHLQPSALHSAIQYRVEAPGLPHDIIELYAGQKIAPGGYAWIFPKKNGQANVGVGVHPLMVGSGTARGLLDRFVAQRVPGAKVLDIVAGGTSGTKPLKTMVGDGLLLVGEAAHQNNPFSGGGIMNALEGAEEAAKTISQALDTGDVTARRLALYDRLWHERAGRTIGKLAAMRKLFYSLEDKDMDNVAHVLQKINRNHTTGNLNYLEIFRTAFLTAPGLLWKARALLW